MFQSLKEKIIVGVVSAVALGAIYAAWDAIKGAGGDVFIPRGVVVAFDFGPNETAVCPDGWKGYREARGRMIVGAGKNSNKDGNGKELSGYEVGDTGGEEEHLLLPDEMPSHAHSYGDFAPEGTSDENGYDVAAARSVLERFDHKRSTEPSGENLSHNNMPPYLALLYCIKE